MNPLLKRRPLTFSVALISVPALTTPFVADYPDVTIRDLQGYPNSVAFKKNTGFFIKYIIKTPPQTVGKYKFTINKDDGTNKYFKVCRLLLIHVGDNYPCTEVMPKSATGYETTVRSYSDDPHAKGKEASYEFKVCLLPKSFSRSLTKVKYMNCIKSLLPPLYYIDVSF